MEAKLIAMEIHILYQQYKYYLCNLSKVFQGIYQHNIKGYVYLWSGVSLLHM